MRGAHPPSPVAHAVALSAVPVVALAAVPVVALAAVLLVAVGPARALAQEPGPHRAVELRWRVPEGCPTAAQVRVAVAHALAWSPFVPGATPELVLDGAAHEAGDRWAVSLALASRAGEPLGRRELVSESARCADALDSVALVAAMMIESPRAEARLRAPPPRPPFGGLALAGSAGVVVDFLTGPAPAVGARAELALTPPGAWPIRLGVTFFPETVATSGAVQAHFRMLALALATCPPVVSGPAGALEVCGGIDVLLLDVNGTGLVPERSYLDATPRPFVGVRGELALLGPLRAGADLEAAVPLARYRYDFRLDGVPTTLHELPVVTVAASLWLALRLP